MVVVGLAQISGYGGVSVTYTAGQNYSTGGGGGLPVLSA